MKFDTVIIGGGLAGLAAGISLAEKGRKTAIVTSGQSALHFNSGSFGLLGYDAEGNPVTDPMSAIASLPEEHPYSKTGIDNIRSLASYAPEFLAKAGITMSGDSTRNRWRLTPLGMWKPAWLTMKDFAVTDDPSACGYGHTLLLNLDGFLDFYPEFLRRGIELSGGRCTLRTISTPALEVLRKSSTEVRAANIARIFDDAAMQALTTAINAIIRQLADKNEPVDTVIMPAVAGLYDEAPADRLVSMVEKPLFFMSTQPMSVGGMRAQMRLRHRFQELGGYFFPGDTVTGGDFSGNRLQRVYTVNFGDMPLEASQFLLASGSFFSHGLQATPDAITEPIFGLEVNAPASRSDWYSKDLYCAHPYMKAGVANDQEFRVRRNGQTVVNLRAAGSVAGGADSLKEESGAGVALLTALHTASLIERDIASPATPAPTASDENLPGGVTTD